jgi:hypothetical protein
MLALLTSVASRTAGRPERRVAVIAHDCRRAALWTRRAALADGTCRVACRHSARRRLADFTSFWLRMLSALGCNRPAPSLDQADGVHSHQEPENPPHGTD